MPSEKMLKEQETFMRQALSEASKAFFKGEVPVGAVLVFEEKIIARAHNLVEERKEAMSHAEFLCLQQGAKILDNWRLSETTLYTTLEPCILCAGAAILSRVKKVVYGAKDLRHGACGTVFDILGASHPIHQVEMAGGVLEKESRELLQSFFQQRRRENEQRTI